MSRNEYLLDLSDLDIDSIAVMPTDELMAEGHGTVEVGASCSSSCITCAYCSCYTTANSCFAPSDSDGDLAAHV